MLLNFSNQYSCWWYECDVDTCLFGNLLLVEISQLLDYNKKVTKTILRIATTSSVEELAILE